MAAKISLLIGMAVAVLAGLPVAARADTPPGIQQAERLQKAVDAMQKVLVRGPGEVALVDQANLRVPADTAYVRQPEAGAWASASGYEPDKDLVGMVTPMVEGVNWVIFIDYHAGAYISDKDASDWDSDDLLQSLRTSTTDGNAERAKHDLPQLQVTGWLEKPDYDAAGHRLIWAAETSEIGEDADRQGSGNIHGFVLGRDGYIEMTMVAPAEEIAGYRAQARAVLAGIAFDAGKRYEDHTGGGGRSITTLIGPVQPSGPSATAVLWKAWPFALAAVCILALLVLRRRRVGRR